MCYDVGSVDLPKLKSSKFISLVRQSSESTNDQLNVNSPTFVQPTSSTLPSLHQSDLNETDLNGSQLIDDSLIESDVNKTSNKDQTIEAIDQTARDAIKSSSRIGNEKEMVQNSLKSKVNSSLISNQSGRIIQSTSSSLLDRPTELNGHLNTLPNNNLLNSMNKNNFYLTNQLDRMLNDDTKIEAIEEDNSIVDESAPDMMSSDEVEDNLFVNVMQSNLCQMDNCRSANQTNPNYHLVECVSENHDYHCFYCPNNYTFIKHKRRCAGPCNEDCTKLAEQYNSHVDCPYGYSEDKDDLR